MSERTRKGLFQKVNWQIENEKLRRIYAEPSLSHSASDFCCFCQLPTYFPALPPFLLSYLVYLITALLSLDYHIKGCSVSMFLSFCAGHNLAAVGNSQCVCSCLVFRGFFSVSPHKTIFLCSLNPILKILFIFYFYRRYDSFWKMVKLYKKWQGTITP